MKKGVPSICLLTLMALMSCVNRVKEIPKIIVENGDTLYLTVSVIEHRITHQELSRDEKTDTISYYEDKNGRPRLERWGAEGYPNLDRRYEYQGDTILIVKNKEGKKACDTLFTNNQLIVIVKGGYGEDIVEPDKEVEVKVFDHYITYDENHIYTIEFKDPPNMISCPGPSTDTLKWEGQLLKGIFPEMPHCTTATYEYYPDGNKWAAVDQYIRRFAYSQDMLPFVEKGYMGILPNRSVMKTLEYRDISPTAYSVSHINVNDIPAKNTTVICSKDSSFYENKLMYWQERETYYILPKAR